MAATESFNTWDSVEQKDRLLARKKLFIKIVFGLFFLFVSWAYFAALDEVSTGTGKVVPSSQEQVIQSLEGGVLAELLVKQDQIVEPGQILAQLDQTVVESTVQESAAKYRAAIANIARLQSEVNGMLLKFPTELDDYPALKAAETRLYETRTQGLSETLQGLEDSRELIEKELAISQALTTRGAASNVDVIRLQRQVTELKLKATEVRSDYIVKAREELAKSSAEAESLASIIRGRTDSLSRMTIRAPVRGVVKDIVVSTIGGVVPPNGKLMMIVPLDETLLIETRISPTDIAYIHPEQRATVKVSAYEYSIYGALDGKVVSISADTMQDEAKPDLFYYRVYIQTTEDALKNKRGDRFPIAPGMIATVDIHTGNKTVFEYMIKPLNRAREALRER